MKLSEPIQENKEMCNVCICPLGPNEEELCDGCWYGVRMDTDRWLWEEIIDKGFSGFFIIWESLPQLTPPKGG